MHHIPNKPRIHVHLGNVGGSVEQAIKTKKLAEKYKKSNVEFYGIDQRSLRFVTPKNWKQLVIDFKKGLEKFEDNSVNFISSEMALGHYGPDAITAEDSRKYTLEVIELAHKKLAPGGKLSMFVGGDESTWTLLVKMLKETPFSKEKIKIGELESKKRTLTKSTMESAYEKVFKILFEK